jgi:hypothetical protein
MPIPFQPPPQVILTSREMLDRERIDHVRGDFLRIRILLAKEIVVVGGNVGQEREREVREDRHETVVFVHPRERFGRHLWRYVGQSELELKLVSKPFCLSIAKTDRSPPKPCPTSP